MTIFELEYMRSALLAAALVGLAAPAIGIFIVQRRLALMGDGIGHVALTGVAAGFLTGTSPVYTAMIAAVIGAVVIELMRERGRTSGDVALALIFYGGIAGGVFLASLAGATDTNLFAYLFGSVLTVDGGDLVVIGVVAGLVLTTTLVLRRDLFAVCYDEEVARVSGLPVRALNILLAVTAAVTIAVAMRVVGILLVSAMLVLPVAAVQQLTSSFGRTYWASIGLGIAVSITGLLVAYYADVRPAATIVLSAIAAFAVAGAIAHLRQGASA